MRVPGPWRVGRAALGVVVAVTAVAVGRPGAVVAGIAALDLRTLAAGVVLNGVATVASAWRWRLVADRLGVGMPLGPAVAACLAAQFLNSTLPGGVLGDVHRGVRHGHARGSVGRGLRAVVWERSSGQLVLLALTATGLLLAPWSLPRELVVAIVGVTVVGLLLGVAAARLQRPGWWPQLRRLVRDDAHDLLVRRVWPGVVAASLVAVACHVAMFALVARAAGVTAPVAVLLPLVLLVLVAAALPMNVAGWGPREGAAAWSFAAAGLGAGQGLACGVGFGVLVLVATLPGAAALAAYPRVLVGGGSRVHA